MFEHEKYLDKALEKADDVSLQDGMIDFYRSIYDYQKGLYNRLDEISFNPDFLRGDEPHDEEPLIDPDRLSLPAEIQSILLDSLKIIIEIIEKHNSGMNLETLLNAVSENNRLVIDYIKSMLGRSSVELEKFSTASRIGVDEFIFILVNWVKPLFIYMMDNFSESIDQEKWLLSDCPFCGYYPDMSMIADSQEGKRFLHCSLCEMVWGYKRIYPHLRTAAA